VIESPQFGTLLTDHGVTFRLWAPAAANVKLVLNRKIPMSKSDGWFVLHVDDATAGTRYAFEVNGDITIPDPASHFQPEDVHGPSEVIDHHYAWQCGQWQGLP
jgi:maltooligosyltrehalose trehalohydrolase